MTNDLNNLGSSTWGKLSNPPRTEGHPAGIVVLNDGKMVCTYSARRTAGGAFTASSGVFLYDPVGNTWSDVSYADMYYWTKDIIVDPADPAQNTWYVCVFSGWGGAPNGKGGLFKTTNRGASWSKLTGTQFDRVTSITFNPSNFSQAYLTTETQGLWISNNMNATAPLWSMVNSYPFRQPERVFFNPYNPDEVWVTSFGNGLKLGVQFVVLPVKLISFSGSRDNDHIILQWVTSNEDRGDQFEIERSIDGLHFEKIGTVISRGSTNNQYRFTENIIAPVLHYRIKIVAAAGNHFYTNIIAFKNNNNLFNDILVMNSVTGKVTLQAMMQKADNLALTLIDLSGKKWLQKRIAVNAGTNQLNILLPSGCTSGIYILQVNGLHVKKNIQVIISK